jgi:hypothetical protein
MSESNINLSPDALLAGIETVAKAIGRTCQMDVVVAMARAEAKVAPAVPGEILASAMTLRDHFAAKAMAAILGNLNGNRGGIKGSIAPVLAKLAYQQADAMLAARGAA